MAGGNVYLGEKFGDPALVEQQRENVRSAVALGAVREASGVRVSVENRGAAHAFPTGVADVREPWVELQAVDGSGKVVARYGGPDASGLIPLSAARFGMDIAQSDGTLLLAHQLSDATRIPFDRRVRPHATLSVLVPAPPSLPAGAVELDAVLMYRNVRTTYFRAATGLAAGASPDIEAARVKVP